MLATGGSFRPNLSIVRPISYLVPAGLSRRSRRHVFERGPFVQGIAKCDPSDCASSLGNIQTIDIRFVSVAACSS